MKFKFSVLVVIELEVIKFEVEALVVDAFETTKLDVFPNSVVILAEIMLATADSRLVRTELVEKMLVVVAFPAMRVVSVAFPELIEELFCVEEAR